MSRIRKVSITVGVTAAGVAVALTAGSALAAARWTDTPTPDIGAGYTFEDLAVLSDTDAWAVGISDADSGTVAAHWDGESWTHTKTPKGWDLLGVSAAAADDVWAVGRGESGSTLLHWTGQQWDAVDSPDPGLPDGQIPGLYAVESAETGGAWAGGCGDGDTGSTGFTQRWDGDEWTVAKPPTPDGADNSCVFGFEYVADDEVWAFGSSWQQRGWILRWDGAKWQTETAPDSAETVTLSSGYRTAEGRLCASGYTTDTDLKPSPYLLCRDGEAWTEIETPDVDAFIGGLGPDGAGGMYLTGSGDENAPVLLHFDGEQVVVDTAPESATGGLSAVEAAPGSSRVWLTGTAGDRGLATYTG